MHRDFYTLFAWIFFLHHFTLFFIFCYILFFFSFCSVATCADGFFQCLENYNCIHISLHCNGRNDCSDGSDELNCPTEPPTTVFPETTRPSVSCPGGYQHCRSRDQCIRQDQICDGRGDCYDLSDELNCRKYFQTILSPRPT